jgi:UDP-2,3-diacylglucosamine pyrophosphatase LpxH
MKNLYLTLLFVLGIICLFSCGSQDDEKSNALDPFKSESGKRNKIVIISDLHLGADSAYAECKENLKLLENCIGKMLESKGIKELVIAGDLIDEWYVPANIDTYKGGDQHDFVRRLASANKGVFDSLNRVISDTNILLTYVPGNHDLAITEANVDSVLPGVNQARDTNILGLGTYSPADLPELVVEHGHRYNFFCSPDPISNDAAIMPPGYFFTRIAALSVAEQRIGNPGEYIPQLSKPDTSGTSQLLLYKYWKQWKWTLDNFGLDEGFDEKIIITNLDHFTDTFAVNDFVPYIPEGDSIISVKMYNGIQDSWDERQTRNNVPVHIDAAHAIDNSGNPSETDTSAFVQYFNNPDFSDKRIVVFGHNHRDTIISTINCDSTKAIYANSGTWIDDNNGGHTTATLVVITPQDDSDDSSYTRVEVWTFENENFLKLHCDSLRL